MGNAFQGNAFQNDAFQAGGPIVVTPPTLALTLTAFAPTVIITDDKVVTPPTLALVLTTYAPTILTPRLVTPSTLALLLTAYAPSVNIGVNITPGTLALILSFYIPAIEITEHVKVTPATLALVLTAYSPTVSVPRLVTPLTLALVLTAYAPTISIREVVIAALKYILELHDSNGNLVSILHNAYGISFSEATNEAPLLDFHIPADDSKAAGLIGANEVWLRNYVTGAVMKKFRLNLREDIRS